MFGKGIRMVVISFILIGLISGQTRGGDSAHQGLSEKSFDELTVYMRRISGKRTFDPAPGDQVINENVYHALISWGDYYVERPFDLKILSLHLHFDVTIMSTAASSKIKIAIQRNGNVVHSSDIYQLPSGQSGNRQVDIMLNETIYPTIAFHQGDEIGFYFQQINNLNPCNFRHNGPAGRDDSHLTFELQSPDYPYVRLSPTDFDLSIDPGATMDTTLEINNLGYRHLLYSVNLPQGPDTLSFDHLIPSHFWSLSDQYGQDFLNVRFTPAQTLTLQRARLLLSEDGSSGNPDLMVYVWDDSEGFPGAKLDSVLVPHSALNFYPYWQIVDFAGQGRVIQGHQDFHIGYTCISHSPGDSLALFSDDGIPVGSQRRSSERWGESWKTMYEHYDIDANFMIRAVVNHGDPPDWISLEYPPGGFLSPDSTAHVILHLDASGLSTGVYRTGVVIDNNSPDLSLTVPVTMRVGQTSVEGDEMEAALPRGSLSVNYPNPFNAGTRIAYQVGSPGLGYGPQPVRLTIYNLLGQRVRRLVDGDQGPGSYSVWWDGRDERGVELASGVYMYRLEVGDFRQMRKMVLLR
jgi:hypothetical protein